MTEQPGLQQRIADTSRPAMLNGLQDAEPFGNPGTERINEWVDASGLAAPGRVRAGAARGAPPPASTHP